LSVYTENSAAGVDACFLRSGAVPAKVIVMDNFPGHRRYSLIVDSSLEHRARWLLKFPPVSEAELEFLATGELPALNTKK